MSHLFSGSQHAKLYAKFRPTYPESVLESIIGYVKNENSGFQQAVDVGCGNGQSTFPLTKFYDRVIGSDISEAQISQAKEKNDSDNISFRVGPAEDMGFLADDTVDLVTCAQALHWLDTNKFYEEVKRVLKPKGVLACFGYGNVSLDSKDANRQIKEYYAGLHEDKFWDSRRRHIDNHFAEFNFPLSEFQRYEDLKIQKKMKLSEFVGYLSSWSAYQTKKKLHPNTTALEDIHSSLLSAYKREPNTTSEDPEIEATWPIFILLGRNN